MSLPWPGVVAVVLAFCHSIGQENRHGRCAAGMQLRLARARFRPRRHRRQALPARLGARRQRDCWSCSSAITAPMSRRCWTSWYATPASFATHGIGSVAICSNDAADYPEDSFDNMKALAARMRFPFPYLWDETQEVAKAYGAICTPDFFGFNAALELQYRGRLDDAGRGAEARCAARALRGDAAGRAHRPRAGAADARASAARSSGAMQRKRHAQACR